MNMKCRHDFEFLEKFVFDDELTSTFLYCRKCLAVCEVSIEVIDHKAGEYDVAMNLLDDLVIRKGSEVKKKAKESGGAVADGKEGTA
jgi:hypothetical protein